VTAIFLHGGLLHIFFNMMALMNIAPLVEELYGSARFFFLMIATGASGYVASSATGHLSVGASGALLGLIGVLIAFTTGRGGAGARMLRSQLFYWLIYIFVLSMLPGVDMAAHAGGFVAGFVLGKVMTSRQPSDAAERRRAMILGWTTGLTVMVSFTFMLLYYFGSI
jgi:rhomboid protease GluP